MSDEDSIAVSTTDSDASEETNSTIEGHCRYQPHDFEPLADVFEEETGRDGDEVGLGLHVADEDDLTSAHLELRFEKEISVDQWCTCGQCREDLLEGSLEYRCCQEVTIAREKLHNRCLTLHEDYGALTNTEVLRQAATLLKDTRGRPYRQQAEQRGHEFLRAVAYRWLTRWLYGCLGWENRKPLPACVYCHLRTKYHSAAARRGYTSS